MPVIAYLLGLTLAGGSFWLLWKLLASLRRRGRWSYYLAAAWAGAVGGLFFTSAFYLTGQVDVLLDGASEISRRETIASSATVGVLLGLGMAWYATWHPSPLNDVDFDEGPWTPEFVTEVLADAEQASPQRRGQIAEELRQMAVDSKSGVPEELARHMLRWEREASQSQRTQLP